MILASAVNYTLLYRHLDFILSWLQQRVVSIGLCCGCMGKCYRTEVLHSRHSSSVQGTMREVWYMYKIPSTIAALPALGQKQNFVATPKTTLPALRKLETNHRGP